MMLQPAGWVSKKVSEVTISYDGKRVPLNKSQREKMTGSYPYFGASGQIDSINDYIFDGKFLLVAEDGENLKSRKKPISFIVEGKFWVNNHAHVMKVLDEVDIDYLCYYFNSLDIMKYASDQVTRPKLNRSALDNITVIFPHLEMQKNIVQKLNNIFDGIERRKADIFHSYEVLSSSLEMMKSRLLLSLISKEIERYSTGKSIKLSNFLQPPERRNPEDRPNEEFSYVEISDIDSEYKQIGSVKNVIGRDAPSRARNVIRTNDVLYATTRPYYRNVALVPPKLDNQICSTGFCVLRVTDSNIMHPKFLYYYMLSDQANEQILKNMRGGNYPAVSSNDVKSISLPNISLPMQIKTIHTLDNVFNQLSHTRQLLIQISKIRESVISKFSLLNTSILRQAFSGKLIN